MTNADVPDLTFPPPDAGLLGFIAPWAAHLTRHVPGAAELRECLLAYGGYEISFPTPFNETHHATIERLLSSAQLRRGAVTTMSGGSGDARSFALRTWSEAPASRVVMQGYALDGSGIWREHTWVEEADHVLDTEPGHRLYFGCALGAEATDAQWRAMAGGREVAAAVFAARLEERERERAVAGPRSVEDALEAARTAEASGDLAAAERMLMRAIRLAAERQSGSKIEAQAAYTTFVLRHRDVHTGVDLLRDLIRDAGDEFYHVLAPLRIVLAGIPEVEAVPALRSLSLADHVHASSLLSASDDYAKSGRFRVAETLARLVMEDGRKRGDEQHVWHGQGQLGRVYEREGRIDEAVELWQEAFRGGSANWVVADRLTLHLERTKQYAACVRTCREALRRIDHPGTAKLIRRRLQRAEEKLIRNR